MCVGFTVFKISKMITLVSLLASTFCPGEGQNHEESQQVVLFTDNNGQILHLTPVGSVASSIQWILMESLLCTRH